MNENLKKGDSIKISGYVFFNYITPSKEPVFFDCPIGAPGFDIIHEPSGHDNLAVSRALHDRCFLVERIAIYYERGDKVMNNASKDTENKVNEWISAAQHLETCRRETNHADTELRNAITALGKLLVPENAKTGEVFNIWVNRNGKDALLVVRVCHPGDYEVDWRK